MKIKLGAVAAGLAAGALALAGPAAAHHNPPAVEVSDPGPCGQLTITATANSGGDHDGGVEVLQYREDGGDIVNVPLDGDQVVDLGPYDTEVAAIQWRVWGGPERDYDDPPVGLPAKDDAGYDAAVDELVDSLDGDGRPTDYTAWGWHEVLVDGCPPSPTPTPTPTATADPTPTATVSATPGGDESPDPAPGVGGEQLPTTGVPAAGLAAAGVGAVVLGGGALLLARRRRVDFTA